MMSRKLLVLGMVVLVSLAACAVEMPAPALPTATVEQFGTPLMPVEPGELEGFESEPDVGAGVKGLLIERAVADLAARLEVTREAVEVVNVEAVEWPDTGLGCPEPGMMYAQVITPGYKITLEAFQETYSYHADAKENVLLCEQGVRPSLPTLPPAKNADDRSPWKPVEANPTVVVPDDP